MLCFIVTALLAAAPAAGAMQDAGKPAITQSLPEPAAFGTALCADLAKDPAAFGARANREFMLHVILRATTSDEDLEKMKGQDESFDTLVSKRLADPQETASMDAAMKRVGADIADCRVQDAQRLECADLFAIMAGAGFMGKKGIPESMYAESGKAAHLEQCGLLEMDNGEGEHGFVAIAAAGNSWRVISAWRDEPAPAMHQPVTRLDDFGPAFCSAMQTEPNSFGRFLAIRPMMRMGLELEFAKDPETKKQMDEMGMDMEKLVDMGIKEAGFDSMGFPMTDDLESGACKVMETRALACGDIARRLFEDGIMGEDPIPLEITQTVLGAYQITECGAVTLSGDDGALSLGLFNVNGAWQMITLWE